MSTNKVVLGSLYLTKIPGNYSHHRKTVGFFLCQSVLLGYCQCFIKIFHCRLEIAIALITHCFRKKLYKTCPFLLYFVLMRLP